VNKNGDRNRQREAQVLPCHTINLSLLLTILLGVSHFWVLPLDSAVTSVPLGASSGGPASVNTVTRTSSAMQDMGKKDVCICTLTHTNTQETEKESCEERLQPLGTSEVFLSGT